jgi:hypothetical protein
MRIAVTALSPAGVDHLRNMKRLHTLDLLLVEFPKVQQSDRLIPDFIVAVAGEVPSLRNFAFICDYIHNQFIEDFAQKYPQKQLLVNKLRYVECSLNFIVKYLDSIHAYNLKINLNLLFSHVKVFGADVLFPIQHIPDLFAYTFNYFFHLQHKRRTASKVAKEFIREES